MSTAISATGLLAVACGNSSTGESRPIVADGPVLRYAQPGSGDESDARIFGVIVIDGGCLFLTAGEFRWPLVWPFGTGWDPSSESVLTPSGESIVIGDKIEGGGGYLSIANAARSLGDSSSLAAACLDDQNGEIALLNNTASAVDRATD